MVPHLVSWLESRSLTSSDACRPASVEFKLLNKILEPSNRPAYLPEDSATYALDQNLVVGDLLIPSQIEQNKYNECASVISINPIEFGNGRLCLLNKLENSRPREVLKRIIVG